MSSVQLAYFIDHLKVSGPQRHLVQVLRQIDKTRFSPQVWTLRGEGELIAEIEHLGIPVYSVGLGKRLLDLNSLPILLRVVRSLKQDRVHIVHCYLSVANVVGTLAAILAHVPVRIVSKRSLDQYDRRMEAWAHWVVNRVADRVTAVAEAVKQFVIQEEGCPSHKIIVIPNGVSNVTFSSAQVTLRPDTAGKIVGTLGRLEWKKGHEYLISAVAEVLRQEPETTFVLIGDGALRHKLEGSILSL